MGFEIGKTVAGYEIVEVLGTSKTGVAYKVRNVFAQRFEVLKILPKSIQDDEEQNARFLREIKVHAQLLHPNIVTFYNAREIEGQLVMTKEFVPGITLEEKLVAGPIAWREASRYAANALSALEYAHAHDIIHRGFSSSNLIITDTGIARLAGFGFAKSVTDPELTAAGVVIGALKYMSPEQVKGETIDARCDIYSLGIVFYEMLVGKVPFDAKSQFEIMMAQVSAPPKHVNDVNAAVPRELGDLVAKALAKSPGERFQTAREFREAIEQFIASQDNIAAESKAESVAVSDAQVSSAEPASLAEVPPPPLPAPQHVSWAPESALELAESKLATMELHSAQPVTESPNHTLSDPWLTDPRHESTPAVETAHLNETSPSIPSVSDDWWISDADGAHPESKSSSAVFEPEPAVVEPAALHDAPAIVPSTSVPDVLTVESALLSAESKPSSLKSELESSLPAASTFELPPEPEQPLAEGAASDEVVATVSSSSLTDAQDNAAPLTGAESSSLSTALTPEPEAWAAITEPPPLAPQAPALDWWALNSQLAAQDSKPGEQEFSLSSPEPEPVAPLASAEPAINSHTTQADLWATDWSPALVESKPESAQLELLSSALEPVKVPLEDMKMADSQAADIPPSHPDLWAAEALPSASESRPAAAELAFSSLAAESRQLAVQQEEPVAEPLSLWTSGPPDTWDSESAAPPVTPKPEAADLQSLSAAIEPPQAAVEPSAPIESSVAPAALEPEPQSSESQTAQTEEALPPVAENPPVAVAAAATAGAPAPVAPKPAQVNSDLLTALFGDTLLSRVSLALVICAITFFLGTVTLFAVLSVTKP